MPKYKDQERWDSASLSAGFILFGVAAIATLGLVRQIGSGAPWNFDHTIEVLLLGLLVVNVPSSWFAIRKERVRLIGAIANLNEGEMSVEMPKEVTKSLTKVLGIVSGDAMLITIACLNLPKH
jgi:hypothetical protein